METQTISSLQQQITRLAESNKIQESLIIGRINSSLTDAKDEIFKFISARVMGFVEQEVRVVLSEKNIDNILREKMQTIATEGRLKEIVKMVAQETIRSINKKLSIELNVTRKLSLSLDSEINRIRCELPLNDEDTKRLMNKIVNNIDVVINKKMLIEESSEN